METEKMFETENNEVLNIEALESREEAIAAAAESEALIEVNC